jgi:hypothetical protein
MGMGMTNDDGSMATTSEAREKDGRGMGKWM